MLPAALRDYSGGAARVTLAVPDGGDLDAVWDAVAATYPYLERRVRDEQRHQRRHVNVYVDGEDVRSGQVELHDGSTVEVIPSLAGG